MPSPRDRSTCSTSPTFRRRSRDRLCYGPRLMWDRNDVRAVAFSIFALLGVTSACSFDPPPDVPDDGDVAVDGAPVDTGVVVPDAMETMADLTTGQVPHDFGDVTVDQTSSI